MFRYEVGDTKGSADNTIREGRSIPVMDKVEPGMMLIPVDIEHTSEFGTYKIRLLHDISSSKFIEMLDVEFEPTPVKKAFDDLTQS